MHYDQCDNPLNNVSWVTPSPSNVSCIYDNVPYPDNCEDLPLY